jgi:hypothetical protein
MQERVAGDLKSIRQATGYYKTPKVVTKKTSVKVKQTKDDKTIKDTQKVEKKETKVNKGEENLKSQAKELLSDAQRKNLPESLQKALIAKKMKGEQNAIG